MNLKPGNYLYAPTYEIIEAYFREAKRYLSFVHLRMQFNISIIM